MSESSEIARQRLERAEELRREGVNPYAYRFERSHSSARVLSQFGGILTGEPGAEEVSVAGRLLTLRLHGKSAFAHLGDQEGRLQIYLKQDILGPEAFQKILQRLDLGDIIGVSGPVFRTKTGELTVQVKRLELLTKALLPPPEKWHGLKDVETRYRQRYLDLMSNPEVFQVFLKRSRLVSEIRRFFEEQDYLEVETPILQPLAGGAAAKPFVTHHNALDLELYLRIAPELYLKRLLVGGFEKVFELNRNFRNEGISVKHNPEFTMVEAYQAYADGPAMMELTERLVARAARALCGGTRVTYQGQELNLEPPFQRMTMADSVRHFAGVDPESLDEAGWASRLAHLPAGRLAGLGPGQRLEELFAHAVEPRLIQPVFITDYPLEISPLAKKKPGSEDITDRFELFIFGREMANGFSELNDPLDQERRFLEQLKARERGDEEAHRMDEDFVCALKHGMPPAGGMGLGVDRLAMLLTDSASIRDVILFPLLRPQKPGEEAEGEGQASPGRE